MAWRLVFPRVRMPPAASRSLKRDIMRPESRSLPSSALSLAGGDGQRTPVSRSALLAARADHSRVMAVSQEAGRPRERRRIKESALRRLIRQVVRVETVAVLVTAWLAGALGLGLATGAGAVPTVALMALGPLLGGLLLLLRHSLDLASRIGNLSGEIKGTRDIVRRVGADVEKKVGKKIEKEIKQTFRQLEALLNLSAVLPASDVLPATRGWAASPDLLVVLVDLVISERPSLVVECGSGASTLWLALAMRRFGIDGRIIALDHDPVFGRKTRDILARHDVRDLAEVRDAPLENFSLDGRTYSWYARRAWEDLTGIDLLFVDGPPATTGHQARYPALPLLSGSLSPVATAVLDDLVVPDMQNVLRRWLDAYPDFGSELLPLEKHAAVLRRS